MKNFSKLTDSAKRLSNSVAALTENALDNQVNEQTLTANLALSNTSKGIQVLTSNTVGLSVTFPATPIANKKFTVKNHNTSTQSITVNGTVVSPNQIYVAVYTGTTWIVL